MRLARVVGAAALLVLLAACGGGSGTDEAAAPSAGSSSAPVAASGAEDEFLRLTATHLCSVQGTVYDDPAALASAYDEAPDYPGLTDQQVADFGKRVDSDPDFSAKLLAQVTTTCGG